jgi:hypothetical protein
MLTRNVTGDRYAGGFPSDAFAENGFERAKSAARARIAAEEEAAAAPKQAPKPRPLQRFLSELRAKPS